MLAGRASYVRSLINESREKFREIGRMEIYNNQSIEIFSERGKFITRVTDDSLITSLVFDRLYPAHQPQHYVLLKIGLECQGCHEPKDKGDPAYNLYKDRWKIRCVVKVSTSMDPVLTEIRRNLFASVGIGLFTVVLMWIVLRIFMKLVVISPLNIIGQTAYEVGKGNLSISANVKSKDEIGILAQQINSMIKGLRERLQFTKFVSGETVSAVERADLSGVVLGGERSEATVLFSDIRGFTSFSEKVEPEIVIKMLNTFLNIQAEVVKEHYGDIDKFIGDELMAVFKGESMVENAIECGIAMQTKVRELNKDYSKEIAIGIGINAGPMVMGAMGSKDRMDYTVIGDNVNLGARLYSAAGKGEIIISQRALKYLTNDSSFAIRELEPIRVKGKEAPIQIFRILYE
ncbi:MAG: HAMP domain-containing protein [Candidatus Marinimicrobia bacterium]|nr:HAMP domain-containing protein [Candidatus Neomarinimicrobiota bacterium]